MFWPPTFCIVSLFAGAGGLDIGFHRAGFETVWANEYDKQIAPSFQKYFPNTKFDGRSILNIPDEDIPENVVGVIGGPPSPEKAMLGAAVGSEFPL